MSRLGVELLSVLGMPPVEHVHLAADLGCSHISTGLTQLPFNPYKFPSWSLRDDPALRRAMIEAMRARGVSISLGEGLIARPGVELRNADADLDIFAELAAERIGTLGMDPDVKRSHDQIAIIADMAASRGMATSIEFASPHPIGKLEEALAAARHSGKCTVTIDVMHYTRSGGTVIELKATNPAMIGYAQLCDAPRTPLHPDYMKEAMFERRNLGEGDIPLADLIAALPRNIPLGLEIPNLVAAEAGVSPLDHLRPSVETANALLQRLSS